MYAHEFDKPKSQTFNTTWPTVSNRKEDQKRFKDYLKSRRLDFETAYLNGWYPSRLDCLRIVIPCLSTKPGHAYYQARACSQKVTLRYASPFGARHGALCPLDPTDEATPFPVSFTAIVEGPMCGLVLAYYGIPAIAVMGIRPDKEAQAHLVSLLKARRHGAVVAFDNEDEAQACAARLALRLSSSGIRTHVMNLDRKDIADSSDDERLTIVRKMKTWQNKSRLSTNNSVP